MVLLVHRWRAVRSTGETDPGSQLLRLGVMVSSRQSKSLFKAMAAGILGQGQRPGMGKCFGGIVLTKGGNLEMETAS